MSKAWSILIVEDDDWLADQFQRTLSNEGMRVTTVAHALAAMDATDTHTPDLIVLDVLLAGPNAFTLLHELRSHSDLSSIPVIFCTNSTESLIEEDIAVYGVRQILDKATMYPEDLIASIRKVLL